MTTGQRIKAARKTAGMTQGELGEKLGVSGSAIAQYETDNRKPKYDTIQRIATALNVYPGELMGLKDYGDNIWGPEGMTSEDLDDVRQRVLAISEDQKALKRLKERMAKKEHITGKLELLNDGGLDIAVQAIDTIVGNPRLSTYPSSRPYFQPTALTNDTAPQVPIATSGDEATPQEGVPNTDTPTPPDTVEGPQEGE